MKSKSTKTAKLSADAAQAVKLSEYQQLVLAKASQNRDAYLIERPKGRRVAGGLPESGFGASARDQRTIDSLLRKGLIEGDRGSVFDLKLTVLAFVSLHIDECEWPKRLRTRSTVYTNIAASSPDRRQLPVLREGTKGAKVLQLMSSKAGASLDEMEQATGWQRHSVRGFISGTLKKKLGIDVVSKASSDGPRTYRVADLE